MNYDISCAYFGTTELNQGLALVFGSLVTLIGFIIYYQSPRLVQVSQLRAQVSIENRVGFKSIDSSSEIENSHHLLIRIFSLFFYFCIAINFRDHLSVWTVFSPKVLTEIANTLGFIAVY